MIVLTKLAGGEVVVNADLIERIEATPETMLTMTDGKKIVVQESVNDVIDEVRAFKASILAASNSGNYATRQFAEERHLAPVSTLDAAEAASPRAKKDPR